MSHDRILSTAQEHAVRTMGTSMEHAGIPLNDTQLDAARDLAAGHIDFAEYLTRVDL